VLCKIQGECGHDWSDSSYLTLRLRLGESEGMEILTSAVVKSTRQSVVHVVPACADPVEFFGRGGS
jgi:hypothetical protein